jgi:hypothetical protein
MDITSGTINHDVRVYKVFFPCGRFEDITNGRNDFGRDLSVILMKA